MPLIHPYCPDPSPIIFDPDARWIWGHPADAAYYPCNSYWMFRRDLTLDAAPKKATLQITASSRYQLFINGRWIGDGPSPCDPAHQVVDQRELTAALREGENQLAVLVHHIGVPTFNYGLAPGGLLAQLDCDGHRLVTDTSWYVGRSAAWNPHSPKRSMQLAQSEIVDLRRQLPDWTTAAPKHRQRWHSDYGCFWQHAYPIAKPNDAPWTALVPRSIPFLEIEPPVFARQLHRAFFVTPHPEPWDSTHIAKQIERETPGVPGKAVDLASMQTALDQGQPLTLPHRSGSGGDVVLIFDFQAYQTGKLFFQARGEAGSVIDLAVGEALESDRVNPRFPAMRDANFVDRVILSQGVSEWKSFHWTAGRYLQLTVRSEQSVTLLAAGIEPSHYPLTPVGEFHCGDDMLDWTWRIGAKTAWHCLHELVTDCPLREQAQWVELVGPRTTWTCFGDPWLVRKMLVQVAESESPERPGRLHTPFPGNHLCQSTLWEYLPDQQLAWIDLLYQHDLHFDDRALLEQLFPTVRRVLAEHEKTYDAHGLMDVRKFAGQPWLWVDWGHEHALSISGGLNLWQSLGLRAAAGIARRLGETAVATQWRDQAATITSRLWETHFDETLGMFCEDPEHEKPSQIVSIMALHEQAVPPSRIDAVLDRALDPPAHSDRGNSHFLIFLLPLLCRLGRHAQALAMIRKHYGPMYELKVPALWEYFGMGEHIVRSEPDAKQKNLTVDSRCHMFSAAATVVLSRHIAGIRPSAPGFDAAELDPQVHLLDQCDCVMPTRHGPIRVQWKTAKDGCRTLRWSAPPTITLRLHGEPVASTGERVCE